MKKTGQNGDNSPGSIFDGNEENNGEETAGGNNGEWQGNPSEELNLPGVIYCAAGDTPYQIACIDGATNNVTGKISVDSPVITLSLSPDGVELWCIASDVMNFNDTEYPISIINTITKKVIDTIQCPFAGKIAFTPDGKKAYISLSKTREIAVYDVGSHSEIKRIKVGNHPFDIAISFDGTRAYVGHAPVFTGNGMSPFEGIDMSQFENVDTEIMAQLENMDFSGFIPEMEGGSEFVSVIDVNTDRVIDEISPGGWSGSLSLSPDGRFLYATVSAVDMSNIYTGNYEENPNKWDGIAVIDTDLLKVTKKLTLTDLKGSPASLAFTPDGKKVYVICGSDDIAVPINVSNHQIGQSIRLDLGG